MSWKCPHCGFDTGLAPLTIKDPKGGATCPRCARELPTGATEGQIDKGLRWIEQESPTFFDHLMEKMDRRAARRRTVRRVGIVVAAVLLALLVYLIVL